MGGTNVRNISLKTRTRLYSLSGGKCAFPDCEEFFHSLEDDQNVSNICHIEALGKNGPRYNPNSDNKYRNSYENLILLCSNHHKVTDDVNKYSVAILKDMKNKHEIQIRQKLTDKVDPPYKELSFVIKQIGSKLFEGGRNDDVTSVPNVEEKISYNNISEYKPIIDKYIVYQGILSKIYGEIEKEGSQRKEVLLKNINTLYLREKGKYSDFNQVRKNADKILKRIEDELWNRIKLDSNIKISAEKLEISILILIVDAFMRCELFEKPI